MKKIITILTVSILFISCSETKLDNNEVCNNTNEQFKRYLDSSNLTQEQIDGYFREWESKLNSNSCDLTFYNNYYNNY